MLGWEGHTVTHIFTESHQAHESQISQHFHLDFPLLIPLAFAFLPSLPCSLVLRHCSLSFLLSFLSSYNSLHFITFSFPLFYRLNAFQFCFFPSFLSFLLFYYSSSVLPTFSPLFDLLRFVSFSVFLLFCCLHAFQFLFFPSFPGTVIYSFFDCLIPCLSSLSPFHLIPFISFPVSPLSSHSCSSNMT